MDYIDYLTGRPQYVQDWGTVGPDTVASSTGAPQGTLRSLTLRTSSHGVTPTTCSSYTTKTREMVVDFRRPRPHPEPVIIKGDCVEVVVHTYKYLGVQLDG
ncbi:hypothetical protein L3Q82_020897 [Scortum barcoo]|uniref:Uncharacterized protein n=1 Tax=Scortum barcoo TaxID=214431 RepID=A0ACB8V8X4_9TELE|nr:hypothetical protein L3Q82_020897 [Scortum barcoo]